MHWLTVLLIVLPIVGLLLNFFLLYVILTEKRLQSNYSKFLILIAIYNMFYALCNLVFDPMFVSDGHGYTMFSLRLLPYGSRWSYFASLVQNLAFATGFGFAAVHTLYRYCTITQKYPWIFETFYGTLGVTLCFVAYNVAWLLVVLVTQKPTRDRLGDRGRIVYQMFHANLTNDGFAGAQYWDSHGLRWLDIGGAFTLISLSSFVFNVNGFVTWKLHKLVKGSVCSQASRNIQLQLVQILATQLIATAFTEIFPFTIVMIGGFFGLSFLCPLTPIIATMFPIVDVLIIVFLVKAFRIRTMEILNIVYKKTPKPLKGTIFSIGSLSQASKYSRNSISQSANNN